MAGHGWTWLAMAGHISGPGCLGPPWLAILAMAGPGWPCLDEGGNGWS